jgi:alkylresorcinol/alkylpyrone synthase
MKRVVSGRRQCLYNESWLHVTFASKEPIETPSILGIGTALPAQRYSQTEIFERYLEPHFGRNRRGRGIFKHAGVDYRHAAVHPSFFDQNRTTAERNQEYMIHSIPLGRDAIQRALERADLTPQDITDFLVVSCTGFDIPGLDLRLAGLLGMRPSLRRACVLGMGCYGAFPGLVRARDAVVAGQEPIALVLALELCSLHLQFEDTLDIIVASALFGDGAAAAVVGDRRRKDAASLNVHGRSAPMLVDATTYCDYQTFDHMAMHVTDHGFKMQLSAYVPNVLAANVAELVDGLLSPHGLKSSDVRFWGVHPGSGKILDYVQDCLGLDPSALDSSRHVLRNYGNMSSPTILFVLDQIIRAGNPQPGDYGVLMGFGPGLTLETALIRW